MTPGVNVYTTFFSSSLGQAPSLLASIRLFWKSLPQTNALAYFVSLSGAEKEGLIKLTAHVYVLRLVFIVADATEK